MNMKTVTIEFGDSESIEEMEERANLLIGMIEMQRYDSYDFLNDEE